MGKYILNIVFLLSFSLSVNGQSWLSPWENRQTISITNYNFEVMTDFQTRLEIPYVSGMQSNFADIRFTNSDGTTLLSHWTEYVEENSKAIIWLELDEVPAFGTADFYMYYINSAAESASNPEETFIFYDDFDEDDGWNIIGDNSSTAIVMFDTLTSTLQKFDACGSDGAWKSIGDTISSFKLITRDYMPADTDPTCTINEYGIETSNFKGINLRRDANDTGSGSEYGLELRDNTSTSGITTSTVNQPAGNWYRTTLSYAYICHFNLHTMMFTDDMQLVGNVYSETFNSYEFDRFTVRGGHSYHLDYVAVAKHVCVWPVVVFDPVIETCPQGTIVSIEDDYCEEGLGMITFSVSGGIPPYIVSWCIDQDSIGSILLDTVGVITLDSLVPGNYNFKIIDSEGCEN